MKYMLGEKTPFLDIVCGDSGLTNSEIESIKEYYSKSEEQIAKTGKPGANIPELEKVRRSNLVWMDQVFHEEFQTFDILQKIYQKVDEMNRLTYKFDICDVQPLQITKYCSSNQGFYSVHADVGVNQENIDRKLSFVIQLSDSSDFEGGEFIYYTDEVENPNIFNETTPQAIKKGSIILFPSFLLHGVQPVTKGIRYSLVGWCTGPRFK